MATDVVQCEGQLELIVCLSCDELEMEYAHQLCRSCWMDTNGRD